jgi:hypothetical protein
LGKRVRRILTIESILSAWCDERQGQRASIASEGERAVSEEKMSASVFQCRLHLITCFAAACLCHTRAVNAQASVPPPVTVAPPASEDAVLESSHLEPPGDEDQSAGWKPASLFAAADWLNSSVVTADYATSKKDDTDIKLANFTVGDVTIKPYGILWGDMIHATSRTIPGPFVLWVASEDDQGESTFVTDARRSRFGVDITGPTYDILGGITGGGKLEIDFFDSFVNENQPGLRLRHVYWEAKNENLRFMVGQYWDVISPLLPHTVNFSVGWAAGNVGFRRTQFRLERYFHLAGGDTLTLQGALAENIIPDLASGARAVGVTRETGHWPMIQGRMAYTFDRGPCRLPVAIGVSGHVGETGFDFVNGDPSNPALGPEDDARFFEWSFNVDAQLPVTQRLRLQSEFFMGANLSNILGGIAQGVCPCLRVPIRSIGGWAEVSYDLNPILTTNLGFGIDDPREADSLIGRTYNRFVFANLFLDVTDHLRTGLEVSHWRTSYHNRTDEPAFTPIASPEQAGKATVVDWTVQYRF